MTIYFLGMGRFKNQNQRETFSNKKIVQLNWRGSELPYSFERNRWTKYLILSLINSTTITGHVDVTESHVKFNFPSDSNCASIGNTI